MLYLKRKIDFFLSAWKSNPDRKPLIVKGPRQVGKTESILRFAKEQKPYVFATLENTTPENAVQCLQYLQKQYDEC